MVKKQNRLLQLSVRELQNDLILPSYERGFSGARTFYGSFCIEDMSLRKYIPKYIKQKSNRNKITCGYKNCIGAMLIQSDLNKWRISQLAKLDQLYIDHASTRLLEISKNDFIEYKEQIFPNDSHLYLISCDASSPYHSPSTITG